MRLREFAPAGGGGSGDYFQALASAWYNGVFDTGSLQKGIKSQEDVERLLNRGIVCPDGKTRKLHIDYNSDFDGVEIYSDDYYEYGDHDDTIDSRTGQKWGPYDFMAFSDEDLSEGAPIATTSGSIDPGGAVDNFKQQMANNTEIAYKKGMAEAIPLDKLRSTAGTVKDTVSARLKQNGPLGRDAEKAKQNGKPGSQGVAEGLNEFAADDGDSGGEDDALRNYARMWWAGDEATQMQIERALAKMGWEIGEDEGGYDNGGVFVVRAGDENGNSYQSWAAEDLTEDGALDNYRSRIGTQGNIQRQNQRQQDWLDAHHQSSLDRMTNHRDAMNRLSNAGVDDTIARQEIRRERMRKDDDDWDKTFDVMRDRLNRYQWSSQKDNAEQGVAEARDGDTNFGHTVTRGSWVVYNGSKAKRFKTHTGAKAYAEKNGGKVASSEFYADKIQKPGMAEGSDDPFGPQGRFVGDTGPAQITTTVSKHELRPGDRVMYKPTGARATIENLYKNGTVARIHVASGMGGQYFDAKVADLRPIGQGSLEEKSTSQAQFRTMAAAAHDPKFARKVGIKQSVAREFNKADKGQSYKSLPKRAD